MLIDREGFPTLNFKSSSWNKSPKICEIVKVFNICGCLSIKANSNDTCPIYRITLLDIFNLFQMLQLNFFCFHRERLPIWIHKGQNASVPHTIMILHCIHTLFHIWRKNCFSELLHKTFGETRVVPYG